MQTKQKSYLIALTIILLTILCTNGYSQDVIEQDGRRYVDVDYHNSVVDDANTAKKLLQEAKENQRAGVKVVEKVVVQDRVVKEYVEVADKEAINKGRKEGIVIGGVTISGAWLLLLLILL
jgi:hypothetical protein